MASSSDHYAERGFVPPRNDEERRLMRRVEELCRVATARGIPRYTGFLSDREQMLAQAACNKADFAGGRFWGGYPQAERKVLCLEPPQAWQEEPLAYLCLKAYTSSGEKLPGHRDYLGAILALGLDRACLGDLRQAPGDEAIFYAVVLADKQELIASELTGAGRCPVQVACCDALPREILQGEQRTLQEATVPSLRVDAVLAAMMHTSRAKVADYIAAGRVEINHLPLRTAHETVYPRDIFTVRGQGRYQLVEIGGKSRKERVFISFFQY